MMKDVLVTVFAVWILGLIAFPYFTGTRVGEISKDFMRGFNEGYKGGSQ